MDIVYYIGEHTMSFPVLMLLALFLSSFGYQLYFYLRYLNAVNCRESKISKGKISFDNHQVPVSVVICARDETENLRKFLPEVLTQEYPTYEVIVVNDGGNEETETLLKLYKGQYPQLRTTFVPKGTTNLSTKKLALTLGIKAAKHEWLILTDADCVPESKHWMAHLARNFKPHIDFVLGYGAYFSERGFLNRLITYDTLFNGLQYLGFAHNGQPYMGVGRNMAYRRSVFFNQKGFASTLHLRSGDDDLMVNQAARKHNTQIETAPDSLTFSIPKKKLKDWFFQKERHISVSTYYRAASKWKLLTEPLTRGVFYGSFFGLLALFFLQKQYMLAAGVLLFFILRLSWQWIIINKSSRRWGGQKYFATLPLFDIFLPIVTLYFLVFGRRGKKAVNMHWK